MIGISKLSKSEVADVAGILSGIYSADVNSQGWHVIERLLNTLSACELACTSDANAAFILSMIRKVQQ
jgi:hypothetical protein